MDKLRIGVLCCARIARAAVIPAILAADGVELIAVASRSAEKADEFAKQFDCEAVYGYDDLLARTDLDAVYIPLPTGMHEEWVIKCLEAGKHALVEKSIAMDCPSAERMVAVAKEKGLLLMESFMFLYHSQHKQISELLESGKIGELRCFRASFGIPPLDSNDFRYDKELGGGSLFDVGTYCVRGSQLFLGKDLRVKAATLHYDDNGVDIHGGAYLENSAGEFAEIAFGFDNFYQCRYELWGSKGKISAEQSFTPGPDQEPPIVIDTDEGTSTLSTKAEDHFLNIIVELKRCIHERDLDAKYAEIINQSRLLDELRAVAKA